jgi:glycosyltransferase involved in cell wall biosynthesis
MNNDSQPLVSVVVITYNQERYIEQCLKGIASQKFDFNYEVVLRDDHSTDSTFDIATELKERCGLKNFRMYRNTENEGMGPNFFSAVSLCRGRYIAICEGDDYWTDNSKLRLQTEAMQENTGVGMSIHPCLIDNGSSKRICRFDYADHARTFYLEDILSSAGQFAPTASYMFRREVLLSTPSWVQDAPLLDFFLEAWAAHSGGCLYYPKAMSAYRIFSHNSFTDQIRSDNGETLIQVGMEMLQCMDKLELALDLHADQTSFRRSIHVLLIAIGNLRLGRYLEFQLEIERAKRLSVNNNLTLKVLYFFRFLPRVARLALSCRRIVYQMFKRG